MQQVDIDRLGELKQRINSEWGQAGHHLAKAAKHLAEAKRICQANGQPFKEWCLKNINLSYHYANKLALAGESPDPQKAIEDMRSSTAQRVKAHREKNKGMVLRNTIDPVEDDLPEINDDTELCMTLSSFLRFLLDERKAALEGSPGLIPALLGIEEGSSGQIHRLHQYRRPAELRRNSPDHRSADATRIER
jgi:hypothetical protein